MVRNDFHLSNYKISVSYLVYFLADFISMLAATIAHHADWHARMKEEGEKKKEKRFEL